MMFEILFVRDTLVYCSDLYVWGRYDKKIVVWKSQTVNWSEIKFFDYYFPFAHKSYANTC